MIEISEYRYDEETGEEHYDNPAYLKPDDYSITFNTLPVTGVSETITVLRTGRVVRGSGDEIHLTDPTRPIHLRTAENRIRMREIFIMGQEKGIICIRRLPPTQWEVNRERRLQET